MTPPQRGYHVLCIVVLDPISVVSPSSFKRCHYTWYSMASFARIAIVCLVVLPTSHFSDLAIIPSRHPNLTSSFTIVCASQTPPPSATTSPLSSTSSTSTVSSFPLCNPALLSALYQPRHHLCRAHAHPDPIHYHFLISPTSQSCLHHLRPYLPSSFTLTLLSRSCYYPNRPHVSLIETLR
jgi:hypothetical protein